MQPEKTSQDETETALHHVSAEDTSLPPPIEDSKGTLPPAEDAKEITSADKDMVEYGHPVEDISAAAVPTEDSQDTLLKKLEEVKAQLSEQQDRYLRLLAEGENFRKRILREKKDLYKYAAFDFIQSFLPALDNFFLGLESARSHPETKAVTDGFAMVVVQIQGILHEYGVKEIDPDGTAFDPHLHNCVAHQPSDSVKEGKIIAVTRKGYQLHDRLLRPASVIVSSGPQKNSYVP